MLYFIRSGQYVKIGVSARPWARLAEFQTANPEPRSTTQGHAQR
jgi:hypothetical protein